MYDSAIVYCGPIDNYTEFNSLPIPNLGISHPVPACSDTSNLGKYCAKGRDMSLCGLRTMGGKCYELKLEMPILITNLTSNP